MVRAAEQRSDAPTCNAEAQHLVVQTAASQEWPLEAADVEQKKTAVKVNNPLQQAFDNPMLGQGDSDSDSDSDGDEQKEQGLD